MTDDEIFENLCVYDKRSPYYTEPKHSGECYCDNCFYGKHKLTIEILKLQERSNWLNYLEMAGVDNWEGYSVAWDLKEEDENE